MLADQLATRERVWAGEPGVVFLCEHPPVITLGRSATPANILDAGDVPVERIERGGEVTYHGPGQLMIYPVIRVTRVVELLARVAGAIAETCAALGAPGAAWRRDPAGVWLGERKLAACGIHVARGVSVHGFALNVDNLLDEDEPIVTGYHWGYADASGRHIRDGYYFQDPRTFRLSARFTF